MLFGEPDLLPRRHAVRAEIFRSGPRTVFALCGLPVCARDEGNRIALGEFEPQSGDEAGRVVLGIPRTDEEHVFSRLQRRRDVEHLRQHGRVSAPGLNAIDLEAEFVICSDDEACVLHGAVGRHRDRGPEPAYGGGGLLGGIAFVKPDPMGELDLLKRALRIAPGYPVDPARSACLSSLRR